LEVLKTLGAEADLEKVKASHNVRRGAGKARNRRYVQRRGPLVVYKEDNGLVKALRNVPGVETVQVSRLNLLDLAPGGHLGRFIVWTKSSFEQLDNLYGTPAKASQSKTDYHVPRPVMTQADLNRIINSDEVQSHLKPKRKPTVVRRKKNALKNLGVMAKLNPYVKVLRRQKLTAKPAEKKKQTKQQRAASNKTKNVTRKQFSE